MPDALPRDRRRAARCARHRALRALRQRFRRARAAERHGPAGAHDAAAERARRPTDAAALSAVPDAVVAAEYHFTADDLEKVFIDAQRLAEAVRPPRATRPRRPMPRASRPTSAAAPSWWHESEPLRGHHARRRADQHRGAAGLRRRRVDRDRSTTSRTGHRARPRLDRRARDPGPFRSRPARRQIDAPMLDYLLRAGSASRSRSPSRRPAPDRSSPPRRAPEPRSR